MNSFQENVLGQEIGQIAAVPLKLGHAVLCQTHVDQAKATVIQMMIVWEICGVEATIVQITFIIKLTAAMIQTNYKQK